MANDFNLDVAIAEYYESQEDYQPASDQPSTPGANVPEPYTGPRTLDGRPAPESAIPPMQRSTPQGSVKNRPARRGVGGVATLGSLGDSHGHDDHDDDDSDYSPEDQPRDLFAGGEKSGLAVQDPNHKGSRSNDPRSIVDELIKKARKGPPPPAENAASSSFRGSGMTLGGDDTPSQVVPDPAASRPRPREIVTRTLHMWEDGYSVDDGPLYRFDDPANANDLRMINRGAAPMHLMGVDSNTDVDVHLNKHKGVYTPQPKKYTPFGGGGQRLGSETAPAPSADTSTTTATPTTTSAAPPTVSEPEIDPSQPTLTLRIQLLNGQRMTARFNTTDTLDAVYGFIERALPGSSESWVVATTFPNKVHTDRNEVLGEMAEFKKGGTAVQKRV